MFSRRPWPLSGGLAIQNQHRRQVDHSPVAVGLRLDTLSMRDDRLWPHELWPRMLLDRPLGVGAQGGHGPIRYVVEEYDPGRQVVFRFISPKGFHGTHQFRVQGSEEKCEILHSIDMDVSGWALITWPILFRPLHDALLEDALDKLQADLAGSEWSRRGWSLYVRILRKMLAGKGGRRR